jgi:hypothetical protein
MITLVASEILVLCPEILVGGCRIRFVARRNLIPEPGICGIVTGSRG